MGKTVSRKKEAQIERITRFEEIYDKAAAAVKQLSEALDAFEELGPQIEELDAYYVGKDRKKDFADDEAGKLPETLKRGVLSEDGVYDLLEEIKELKARVSGE